MDAAGNVTTDAFQVAVAAVNDAPAIAAPGGQSVDEDNPLIFSQDNSNAIAVSDVDVAETSGGQLEVSLSVGSGTLTLSGTAGLDFGFAGAQGSGVGDATMTFRGTAADINAALEGLTYAPGPDFNGSDTLAITTNDLGNSGAGGPLSDTKSVAITVNAVNDAPVAKADSNNTDKNTPVSGNVLTNDTDIEGDALVVTSAGTFTTAAGATVTLHPDGSYSYDPTTSSSLNALALGATATDSFNYSISDGNGGTSSATVTIMVSGVNDAPVPSPGPSPGLTAGERYLSRVYINLFGRPVDPEGMAHWGGMLNAGADPLSIVRLLQQSIEYHTREIELAYRRYLHHDADPVGMSLALNYLNSGGTIETILAVIFASPEYYQTQGGGNNTSFSDAIYRDTVGRPLDAASRPLVLSFLTNGGSRFRFAEALLNSLEYEQKMVAELYQTFLHRGLDAKAIDAVLALHRGGRVEEVIAGIVGSPEAFSLAQS
jgi:VCBS repeat-containing protein